MFVIVGVNGQDPSISAAPINTAQQAGGIVTLFCTWQNTGAGRIQWFIHILDQRGIRITDGEKIEGDTSKYGLSGNHGSGEYNLKIKSLTDSDVGDYACFTQLSSVRFGAYVLRVGKHLYL